MTQRAQRKIESAGSGLDADDSLLPTGLTEEFSLRLHIGPEFRPKLNK